METSALNSVRPSTNQPPRLSTRKTKSPRDTSRCETRFSQVSSDQAARRYCQRRWRLLAAFKERVPNLSVHCARNFVNWNVHRHVKTNECDNRTFIQFEACYCTGKTDLCCQKIGKCTESTTWGTSTGGFCSSSSTTSGLFYGSNPASRTIKLHTKHAACTSLEMGKTVSKWAKQSQNGQKSPRWPAERKKKKNNPLFSPTWSAPSCTNTPAQ